MAPEADQRKIESNTTRRSQRVDLPSTSDPDSDSSDTDVSTSSEEPKRNGRRRASNSLPRQLHFPQSSSSITNPFRNLSLNATNTRTRGKVSKKDGRLNISVHETADHGHLAKTLLSGVQRHLNKPQKYQERDVRKDEIKHEQNVAEHGTNTRPKSPQAPFPRLKIVIMVIGSRGDIQPFIKVGKILQEQHGHRVRIATHPAFRDFVEQDCGLEFFSVGGNPSELMAFMVKNPGLIPSLDTVKKGEVGRRREQMSEMFEGFWRACVNASDTGVDDDGKEPFIADAIIANPPSFAHVHCAERLGCPLHIMFTFPYTPTQSFPHPLANMKKSNVDPDYTNFISYPLVEMMTWQGLGDLVNRFRVKTLALDPVSTIWAPGQLYRLKVPYSYLWSPSLCPKPNDWGTEIDISGFVFLNLASSFKPSEQLSKFLEDGEPPIYIGFGSIVVENAKHFTEMIFQAVEKAGVRAVINEGWGGIGDKDHTPDHIFMLENTPHDWLFPRCKAVVHHGGAGTTAIGLKCAKPTMIVPFFGDQPFWGAMVAAQKAGAHECIPYKELDSDKLATGIKQCLESAAQENVQRIADSIAKEGDGAANAVESFLNKLPMRGQRPLRCSIVQDRAAVWQFKHSNLRLSAIAAELLANKGELTYSQLKLWRQYDWSDFQGSGGPLTGGGGAIVKLGFGVTKGLGDGPVAIGKGISKQVKYEQSKHQRGKKIRERARSRGESDIDESSPQTAGHIEKIKHVERRQYKNGNSNESQGDLDKDEEADADASHLPEHSTQKIHDTTNQLTKDEKGEEQPQSTSALAATRQESGSSLSRTLSKPHDIGKTTALGLAAPFEALLDFPIDLFTGIANGFHNAPRLYGDTTVRQPVRITGMRSGVRAATAEFFLGTYDAVTGLVTQPYQGARKDGLLGFAKGTGKGVTGLVLKECAAITGPFGFLMKGMQKEVRRRAIGTPVDWIRAERMRQGEFEVSSLSEEERKHALDAAGQGWAIMGEIWRQGQRIKKGEVEPHETGRDVDVEAKDRWIGGRLVKGMVGRVKFEREKKKWEDLGAFESLHDAEKVMEARKEGVPLDEIAMHRIQAGDHEGEFGREESIAREGHQERKAEVAT